MVDFLDLKKVCNVCGVLKPLREFHKSRLRGSSDGHRYNCKECNNKAAREWSYNNSGKTRKLKETREERRALGLLKRNRLYNYSKEELKQRAKDATKKWIENNKESIINNQLKHSYGISLDKYKEMLEKQNSVCAICNKSERGLSKSNRVKRLSIDHDHKTGKVRGLLCHKCNMALGWVDDDIDLLYNLIKYLTIHNNRK